MSFPIPASMTAGGVNRDYQSILADLLRLVPHMAPEWTYLGEDDFGVVLLELQAYLADHLHYRADTVARDLRVSRTPYRDVARELAEWLGYMARRPVPAVATLTLTLNAPLARDQVFPRGTQASADHAGRTVYFELDDDVVVPAGGLAVSGFGTEGQTVLRVSLGTATGRPLERFIIPHEDAIFNWGDLDLLVEVGGEVATHSRYAALAGPSDLSYWVRQRRDGRLEVRFGDGTNGTLLPRGMTVFCTYRRGGGRYGNVPPTAIKTPVSQVVDIDGTPVTWTVSNAGRASGGLDEEPIDSIRMNAPAHFRRQARCLTLDDYVAAAQEVAGVFQASAVASGVNGVRLYVVPDGAADGAAVTDLLRRRVLHRLESEQMATDCVAVVAATLVPVDATLRVRAYPSYRNGAVVSAVRAVFEGVGGLLTFPVNSLGQALRLSDMTRAVDETEGVSFVDVDRYSRRPTLTWLTRTGDADLSSDSVALARTTRSQDWYLEFYAEPGDALVVRFRVTGTLSGLQLNVGELDVAYTDDAGELSFTVLSGVEPMGEGDRAVLRVGGLVGNIELAAHEFPVLGKLQIVASGGVG